MKFVPILTKNQPAKLGFDMLNGLSYLKCSARDYFHSFTRTDFPTEKVGHRGVLLKKTYDMAVLMISVLGFVS